MLRISKAFIPVLAAALVVAARTDETGQQSTQPASARQSSESSAKQKNSELSQEQRNQQSTFQPGQISESQLKKTVTEVNKASAFIGMSVKSMQNENLGKVHDLVFDLESGRISYAVVSVGGVLGVGDKLIAIPVTSLKPQPGQKHLVLNMDKNQVQSAPGLAQHNWPDLDATGIGAPAGSESEKSSGPSQSSNPKGQGTTPSSSGGSNDKSSRSSSSKATESKSTDSSNSDASRSTSDRGKDQ